MSVRIEILDYVKGDGDNIINVLSGTPETGWASSSITSATFAGDGTGNVKYYEDISLSVISGREYTIKFQISNYSGSGNIGFSESDSGGTALGITASARRGSNGTTTETFTAVASGKIRVFSRGTVTAATMSNISVVDTDGIDWENSMVGELDITEHSDFPLAMTFQISDFKDITSTSGDYSKTFKFPATKNNNNILKHLYIPNINVANNVTERKPCRIISDGMYTQLGLIRITAVGGYGKVPSSYSGVFYGNNLTWASDLGDAYMNQLDWGTDGEDLTYNKDSIVATWQDVDCNSNPNSYIVYPITSYGQYNEEGDTRTIQLLDTAWDYSGTGTSAKVGYFGYWNDGSSYETPTPNPDWRPAVFVKNTLDKLFGSVGYKISSAFMDTAEFKKNVWLLPNFKYNNPDDRFKLLSYGNKFTGEGLIDSFTASTVGANNYNYTTFFPDLNDAGADFVLNTNTDNTGWDAATGIFTAQEYGNYTINANNFGLYFDNWFNSPNSTTTVDYVSLSIQVQTVGQSGSSSWVSISSVQSLGFSLQYGNASSQTGSIPLTIPEFSQFLNKGDKLRLKVMAKMKTNGYVASTVDFHLFGSSTPTSATTSSSANGEYTIAIDPNNVEYGQTYNLKDVMNPDYKQIDFIKGIAHAYNLQMTTDESTKTVYIEPFDGFYKPYNEAIDWTSKLSRADETTDKWIENDLKRSLVFKYKSDSADGKVKQRGERYFDGVEDEYPYRETLPDTFERGDSTFENPFFAGTYNAKNTNTTAKPNIDTAYSACLWTGNHGSETSARSNKGFDFLPRLLYWNKYSPASGTPIFLTKKRAKVQTWSSDIELIAADASLIGTNALSGIYPQATMVNRDSTTSPNLAYGNVWVRDYDDATGVYTAYQTGKGLYDTYYKNMVEMLKRSPRLRTVSLDLKVTDIINLDFRKLVYIDGVYWRINRVVDYMPNNNSTTKVELIEWFQIGVFAATAPAFGSSGNNSNWGVGGSYSSSTSAEAEPPNSMQD